MNKIISFMKKRWKLVLFIIFIIGVVVFFVSKNSSKEQETTEIKRGNIKEDLILSGEIDAINFAKLSFETSGKIIYVGVKEGEKVNKGRLISKIDSTVLNSNYQIALSNLRALEATVDNVHDQVKDKSTSENYAERDQRTTAEANKDKAYEAMIIAKRNLDGASLYAPFNGIVTNLVHPFSGVYTSLGVVEAEVIDPSTMYFRVLADQTEVTKITVGQKTEIAIDPFEGKTFEGKVESVGFTPSAGESGSTYEVKVSFVGIDLLTSNFKMAMTGDSKFITSEKKDALYIPNNYIKQDKDGKFLKINKNGDKEYITTGIEGEDTTEVIGNIKEGQTVFD